MKNPLRISTAVLCVLFISISGVVANDYHLWGEPGGYDFPGGPTGTVPPYQPDTSSMAAAIAQLWGAPVSTVGCLADENTGYPPITADTNNPPYYTYGPGPNGTIDNINLNRAVLSGIVRGELIYTGTDLFAGWAYMNRFVLRAYTSTQFYDVLVKVNSWSGESIPNTYYAASWSFYQVSGPRPISGSVVVTSAVSRKTHGSAGTFDVSLPLTGTHGIECRKGGSNQVFTMIVTFSNTLSSVCSAGITSGTGTISSSSIGSDQHQYIVNLTGVANAQHLAVTINGIIDSQGNITSAITVPMDILIADTDATGTVNSTDVTNVQNQVGHTVTSSNFREDVDASGAIDNTDVTLATNKKGTHLP